MKAAIFAAILMAKPVSVLARVSPSRNSRLIEAREGYLHLLPFAVLPGALGHQKDTRFGWRVLQSAAPVGEVSKQPPGHPHPQLLISAEIAKR